MPGPALDTGSGAAHGQPSWAALPILCPYAVCPRGGGGHPSCWAVPLLRHSAHLTDLPGKSFLSSHAIENQLINLPKMLRLHLELLDY